MLHLFTLTFIIVFNICVLSKAGLMTTKISKKQLAEKQKDLLLKGLVHLPWHAEHLEECIGDCATHISDVAQFALAHTPLSYLTSQEKGPGNTKARRVSVLYCSIYCFHYCLMRSTVLYTEAFQRGNKERQYFQSSK